MQVAYALDMDGESPRRARRRKKLQALLDEIGGATQAEIDTGTPRTHFVALAKGRRGVGDDLAAKLEAAYGKPPGWFDADDGAMWPFSFALREKVLLLQDEELLKAENVLRAHLGLAQRNLSDFANRKELATDEQDGNSYAARTEEGAGPLDEAELTEAPKRNARQTNQRPARQKGGGGA